MEKESFKQKFENAKKGLEDKKKDFEDKREKDLREDKKGIEPLVTCRVLFISVLDKIMLVVLAILLVVATFINFRGPIASVRYGFFLRCGKELVALVSLVILYFFLNWMYRCASKTMLCVTKHEVYKEAYAPFKRKEISIPLNKITGVSTFNAFWIFRSVTVHQYGKLPLIFFTWKNKEFKKALTELITTEDEKVKNDHEDKNLLKADSILIKIALCALCGAVIIIAIVRFFNFIFSAESKAAGTYKNDNSTIVLKRNGKCNVDKITNDKVTSCEWMLDDEAILVSYHYDYVSSYSNTTYDYTKSINLTYDAKGKKVTYNNTEYKK